MPFAAVGRNALNRHSSEKQGAAMLVAGHRMITYYRRALAPRADRAWDTNSSRWPPIFMSCSAGSACAGATGGDR